jgi:hypothetical protein
MMYDHEKSDPAIVAMKPTNKARQPAAESAEPRAGAEGNVSQQSTGRAQYRGTVSQALKRIRHFGRISRRAVRHPRWEKLWGGRRRSWHLHRPYEPMEVAPWPKLMISAEA